MRKIIDVNVVSINRAKVAGSGQVGDLWRASDYTQFQKPEKQLRTTSEEGWFEQEQVALRAVRLRFASTKHRFATVDVKPPTA